MLKNLHEENISLRKLKRHPNIINTVATFKSKRNFYLIVEYCNAGDLESLLEAGLTLTEQHVRYIFGEILKGMKAMSTNGILHRDIKNANILLNLPGYESSHNKANRSEAKFIKNLKKTLDNCTESKIKDCD